MLKGRAGKLVAVFLTILFLAGCQGAPPVSPESAAPKDYKGIIEQARSPEDVLPVVDETEADMALARDMIEFLGVPPEDMQAFAMSISLIIPRVYGIAIILPAAGKGQAVLDAVNTFVAGQQQLYENYVQDQYEIAKSAIVKTTPGGEVLLVMCEGERGVAASIENLLAA